MPDNVKDQTNSKPTQIEENVTFEALIETFERLEAVEKADNPTQAPLTFKQKTQLLLTQFEYGEFAKTTFNLALLMLKQKVATDITLSKYLAIPFGKPGEKSLPPGVQLAAFLPGAAIAMATGILSTLGALGLTDKQKIKFIEKFLHNLTEYNDSIAFMVLMTATVLSNIFGEDPPNNAVQEVLFGLFVPFTLIMGIIVAHKAHHAELHKTWGNRLAKFTLGCAEAFFLLETMEAILALKEIELLDVAYKLFHQSARITGVIVTGAQFTVSSTFSVLKNIFEHTNVFHGFETFAFASAFGFNMWNIMKEGLKTVFKPVFIAGEAIDTSALLLAVMAEMAPKLINNLKTVSQYQKISEDDNIGKELLGPVEVKNDTHNNNNNDDNGSSERVVIKPNPDSYLTETSVQSSL